MAALVQTIAVVDKSGKAVSTSKHLVNVFKEAKAAYRERKAEVVAGRHYEIEEKRRRKALKAVTSDDKSTAPSRSDARAHHDSTRPSTHHRHHSGSSTRGDLRTAYPASEKPLPPSPHSPRSPRSPRSPHSPHSPSFQPGPLTRSYSAQHSNHTPHSPRQLAVRSMTSPVSPKPDIDMDLAYGPVPPPLPVAHTLDPEEEEEFKSLIQKVRRILEEADCLQYSASAMVSTLQKNPDAMAAVALTLAEISNVVAKMAPGVLTAMKASSPAVFALLASPQFLIAGGVAVGVTVVAFGGYKIVKKIRAKRAIEAPGMDEMLEIDDVSRIDTWRRGIAEEQERSIGTSVEGEFITPTAAAMSKLNLTEATSAPDAKRKGRSKKTSSSRSGSEKESKTSSKKTKEKKKEKVKKPSPLRSLFT